MKKTFLTLSAFGLFLMPFVSFAGTSITDETDPERIEASTRLDRWNNMTDEEKANVRNGYGTKIAPFTAEESAAKAKEIQAKREAFQEKISSFIQNRRGNRATLRQGKDIQSRFLEAGVQIPSNWEEMAKEERQAFAEKNGITEDDSTNQEIGSIKESFKNAESTERKSVKGVGREGRSLNRGFAKKSLVISQKKTQTSETEKPVRQGKWDFKRTTK